MEELQRQHENTLRENDIFRHMIDYLTRSIEATKGTAISEKSAEGVANRMIRRYKSEADKGKLALNDTPKMVYHSTKINFGGDGILQYHPTKKSHHGGAYYKISTGKGGTKRYELDGTEKEN